MNSLFSSIAHILIGLFGFLVVSFLNSLYILDISPLLDVGLVKIFPQYVMCLFFVIAFSVHMCRCTTFF